MDAEQLGKDFAKGFISEMVRVLICIFFASLIFSYFSDIDSTDDGWYNRSGLKIITDKETGCQYLRAQDGGVIRREGIPCAIHAEIGGE